ncbi:hypothetical protein BGZ72_003659, partial [Mortierella alpina]
QVRAWNLDTSEISPIECYASPNQDSNGVRCCLTRGSIGFGKLDDLKELLLETQVSRDMLSQEVDNRRFFDQVRLVHRVDDDIL